MARLRIAVAALGAVILATSLSAQSGRPTVRTSKAEFQLVGVKLYDPGVRVIQLYGNPNEIQGLGMGGGGTAGPSGPAGSPSAGGTSGGGSGGPSGSSATALSMRPDGMIGDPFNTGTLNQFAPEDDPRGGGGPPSRPSAAGAGGGGGSRGGFDPGGGSGGSGIENAGTGASTRFTRWVYKKGTSQFAFVFDRRNRVVQIEAVGLNDYRVKTRRSVKFGSDFSSIIKSYGAPEGYDVGGNNLVVKYLVDTKVAFRLTRTQPNAPHRVTGIVIAAGKG